MKSQKGVTLTSLVVYIILLIIILGILGVITANFQNSVKDINQKGAENVEIDKFNVYFLQEMKKTGNEILSITPSEIKFTKNKYTFKENAIYLNDNIKIAKDISQCEFSQSLINGKTIVTVNIQAENNEEKTIEYVLNDQQNIYNYEDESSYVYTDLIQIQSIDNNQTNNI